jgi:hypothetical protein
MSFFGVGHERELAHQKSLARNVDERAVHRCGIVGKEAKLEQFARELFDVGGGIIDADSDQNKVAATNATAFDAGDRYRSLRDTLHEETHESTRKGQGKRLSQSANNVGHALTDLSERKP